MLIALLGQNLRHIVRTKLLLVLLIFSFLVQYAGVRFVQSVTIKVQGLITGFDSKDSLFVALLFQLFTGAFLSAVYGIWLVPYAHQGQRSHLTFTLPVSKWLFPLTYALSMLALLLLQHVVMALSFGANFGFDVFLTAKFPWDGLLICIVLETLAFEVFTFAFAASAMTVGQIPTFFMGGMAMFMLQLSGAVFRYNLDRFAGNGPAFDLARWIYFKLPPVGELVYDLRLNFVKPNWTDPHLILWAIWLVVFVLLFRLKLRYPAKTRSASD